MNMPERKYTNGIGYRYGFNGKELDKETSNTTTYDYGFRIYSPGLGRFLSVDPLTKEYAALTPYQFASNNPVEGIDLDGLEYVSSKDVRIEVVRGIVKLKIDNMTTVVKNTLTAYNNDSKNWKAGEIGVNFNIGSFNLSKTTPAFPSSDTDPADGNPNNRPDQMAVGNPTTQRGTIDQRYKDRTVTTASPGGARGFAVLQVAMMAIEKGVSLYIQNREGVDNALISKHVGALKSAAADVKFALKERMIPPEFQTEEYLSDIINVVLSGESYVSKYDEATGAKLKQLGMSIYNKLSVKRKESTTKIVETSALDGIPMRKVETVKNPAYDATYVAENPPLDNPPKP